jgi:phosphoribosylanthranilate isomerase
LGDEIKNNISHRAVAFKKAREYLRQYKKPTKIKICGITNMEDALLAFSLGVDAVGFVFAESKRRITAVNASRIIDALPMSILKVGVFVNEEEKRIREILEICRLDALQFHGDEPPSYIRKFREKTIKSFRIKDKRSLKAIPKYKASAYLLDTYSPKQYGGTGKTFNWDSAVEAKKYGPIILAGGLNPDNVEEAIRKVQPCAVDVSSGVESSPGKKDPRKLEEFVKRARGIR